METLHIKLKVATKAVLRGKFIAINVHIKIRLQWT
jgi:hypothetical protein